MEKDFYAILGVQRDATAAKIRERFLQLTREKHPDRFQGEAKNEAELAFQDITQAFNVLISPERRREHDLELARPGANRSPADPGQLAKVYLQRGVKAYKAKNFLEAAENFRRATDADRDNAMAWHHLARACMHQQRWLSQATEAVSRACELDPMKVSYLKLAGEIFARAGRKDKAIHYYRQAIKWGGDDLAVSEALEELTGEGKKKKSLLGGIFGRN